MDKPIPEAAVDALYDELFRVGRGLYAPAPIDPKGIIRRHLNAAQHPDHIVDATKMVAQQHGQGGGEVLARGWLHRRGPGDDYDLHDESSGAGKDCAKCVPCVILRADTAPPSAPVGVEDMQGRLDREESDHMRTIGQRDAAEDAIGRMFQAVTGRPAEWSSAWGYVDAIEEVEEHVAALAQQPAAEVVVTRDDDGEIIRVTQDGRVIAATTHAGGKQPAAADGAGKVPVSSKVPVSESALRYCIRELNGARRGDNAEGRAEIVHHVLTAWLDLATQHQEPTTCKHDFRRDEDHGGACCQLCGEVRQ